MDPDKQSRIALKIVAWTLISVSACSLVAAVVTTILTDALMINLLDIVNLHAGRQLLRYKSGWRKYAIFYYWYVAIVCIVVIIFVPYADLKPPQLENHRDLLRIVLLIGVIVSGGCLAVLHHPKVRALFAAPRTQAEAGNEETN